MADVTGIFLLVLTFVVSTGASIISGMAGGGSGFIIAPFFMLIGLPPNMATATAKMNEVGINASCIATMWAMRRKTMSLATTEGVVVTTTSPARSFRMSLFIPLLAMTMLNVAVAAWLIPRLQAEGLQYVVAALLLAMIPTLFIDKKAFKPGARPRRWHRVGYGVYYVVSLLQAVFGMGIGMFISLLLMYVFGLPASEANDMKRRLMVFQSVVLLALLLVQGAVLIGFGVAAFLGAIVGGVIGTRVAVKKGNIFIKKVMAVAMAVSAIAILLQV